MGKHSKAKSVFLGIITVILGLWSWIFLIGGLNLTYKYMNEDKSILTCMMAFGGLFVIRTILKESMEE